MLTMVLEPWTCVNRFAVKEVSVTDLHYWSAVEAIRRSRTRDLSPVELMAAVIARAQAVEPHIIAFANRYVDGVLEAARPAERPAAYRRCPQPACHHATTCKGSMLAVAVLIAAWAPLPVTVPSAAREQRRGSGRSRSWRDAAERANDRRRAHNVSIDGLNQAIVGQSTLLEMLSAGGVVADA